MAFAGQFVAVVTFGDDTLALQVVEPLRQNTWVDTRYTPFDLAVTLGPLSYFTDNEGGPFLTDDM